MNTASTHLGSKLFMAALLVIGLWAAIILVAPSTTSANSSTNKWYCRLTTPKGVSHSIASYPGYTTGSQTAARKSLNRDLVERDSYCYNAYTGAHMWK